jgi:hypothetical protein
MRHAMGVAVFAGMIGVTSFGLFLTPNFYVLLRGFVNKAWRNEEAGGAAPVTLAPAQQGVAQ